MSAGNNETPVNDRGPLRQTHQEDPGQDESTPALVSDDSSAGRLDNFAIGARLRALREAAGLNQAELAERANALLVGTSEYHDRQVGLDRVKIIRVEAGRRVLKYSEAVAITTALSLTLEALIPDAPY